MGNSYTYTQADMKADGGQVRDVVFKVRGRAVTGKTGNWAQIAAQNPQLQALQGISPSSPVYRDVQETLHNIDQTLRDAQPVLNTLKEKPNALIFNRSEKDPIPKGR